MRIAVWHNLPQRGAEPRAGGRRRRGGYGRYRERTRRVAALDAHCRECAGQIGRFVSLPKALHLQEPNRGLYEAGPRLPWAALPPARRSWWSPSHLGRFWKNLLDVQSRRVLVREERQNARACDLILVNSFFSRESVLRAYGIATRVCYLGVDTELFSPCDVPRERFVVGLGALQRRKGVEDSIRAVATIEPGRRPPLVWIGVVAEASHKAHLEGLARDLGVHFLPKVMCSDDELIDTLSRASVMIFTPRLEPFGLAPLEANACGVPVVGVAEGHLRSAMEGGRARGC